MAAATLDFSGKVVLVTGGTKGLGRVIASRFADAGAVIAVCARRPPEAPLPEGWQFVAADLRDGEQAYGVVDAVVAQHGRIDVLVNNAGGSPWADTATAPARFHERIIALNLLAPIYCMQRANVAMQAQPEGGSIVNISSVCGTRPSPGAASYGAAKAGLNNFTSTVAMEWAPKVRVNAITSGYVLTEGSEATYGDAEAIANVGTAIPMGRLAHADEIADVCLWLASPYASYVSGASVAASGGGEPLLFLDVVGKLGA